MLELVFLAFGLELLVLTGRLPIKVVGREEISALSRTKRQKSDFEVQAQEGTKKVWGVARPEGTARAFN